METMAVTDATHPPHAETHAPSKLAAWSGVIAWSVYGIAGLLVLLVVVMLTLSRMREGRVEQLRQTWDEVYRAQKEKHQPEERIAALEGVWEKVSGSPVFPYVVMELGQLHFDRALAVERSPAERKASLEKTHKVYDVARQAFPAHRLFGAFAAEGAALVREQEGERDEAIKILGDAVETYDSHFLFPQLCYHLGRNLWMRARAKEADPNAAKQVAADREAALRRLNQALAESGDEQTDYISWRPDARFLKSLLEKPGPGLPDGKAPPAKPRAEKDAKKEGAAADDKGAGAKSAAKPPAPPAPEIIAPAAVKK